MSSVLPGMLVQGLVTAVLPIGLNIQVLGFYNGTVDQFHLPPGDVEQNYKVGQKVKARIVYDISPSTPPRFALSLAHHVVSLKSKHADSEGHGDDVLLQDAYTIGTIIDAVKVVRVEPERGLIVQVSTEVEGFVHVSAVFNYAGSVMTKVTDLASVGRTCTHSFRYRRTLESGYGSQS